VRLLNYDWHSLLNTKTPVENGLMKGIPRCIAFYATMTVILCTGAGLARGEVVVKLFESGSDVVLSWNGGTLNLAALNNTGPEIDGPALHPALGGFFTDRPQTEYSGVFSVTPFGTGAYTGVGGSASGSALAFNTFDQTLRVSSGYVSGAPYAPGSITVTNQSFASLGMTLTQGSTIDVVSWGAGSNYDYLRFEVVPEPCSAALLGIAALTIATGGRGRSAAKPPARR
jgi:hypothetical protein